MAKEQLIVVINRESRPLPLRFHLHRVILRSKNIFCAFIPIPFLSQGESGQMRASQDKQRTIELRDSRPEYYDEVFRQYKISLSISRLPFTVTALSHCGVISANEFASQENRYHFL